MEFPLSSITPQFPIPFTAFANPTTEPPNLQHLIHHLNLSPHIEGGYFRETDRARDQIVCPAHEHEPTHPHPPDPRARPGEDHRALSTTCLYLLTPKSPIEAFHRTRGRVVHTLHRGRGVCMILKNGARIGKESSRIEIESFIVGQDVAKGERLQWVVEGGCYKASLLVPDGDGDEGEKSGGLLVSETVMPGFEYRDHEFLTRRELEGMLDPGEAKQLGWLLRENFTHGSDFP
ncbi:hypothetical protein P170DRAFT_511980 [Aspergillus steynii IBT 23096]|uniref:DUF985 domain-containing protein n=1 Tax=Aspergillus steynii IBT 23096 TaxID=1392250 RepID=A0A2I2G3B8_9EURO|nr:uncharacterized protein P170DRAFT_511980 [Aspergillus steynii IBT 23096]PLB47368.1 hypothetical protein P170DRAFT_511980 [Aspergillus steynii IBT 23096]